MDTYMINTILFSDNYCQNYYWTNIKEIINIYNVEHYDDESYTPYNTMTVLKASHKYDTHDR